MKYLYLTFLLFSFTSFGQTGPCTEGAAQSTFQSFYNAIAQQSNDQVKLDVAVGFTGYNCVSSAQVKTMAMLFTDEQFKLDFCMLSYHNTFDKYEFYEVYDAFSSFSKVFRLHDFVLEQRAIMAEQTTNPPPPVEVNLSFPTYNYPNSANYAGNSGCNTVVSDADFDKLAKQMNHYVTDEEKVISGTVAVKNHCMNLAQTMKLTSLIQLEVKRLEFLKTVYQYVYDQGNYASAQQCFTHDAYKKEWMLFCEGFFLPTEAELQAQCIVSEENFKGMLKKINDASFADDQMSLLKMMNSKHCFTTAQVKRIMGEFSFPENKLDAAILLHEKCIDNEKYYELKGSFSFPSYESDFEDFVNSH